MLGAQMAGSVEICWACQLQKPKDSVKVIRVGTSNTISYNR